MVQSKVMMVAVWGLLLAVSQIASAQTNPTLPTLPNGAAAAKAVDSAPAPTNENVAWNEVLRELQILRGEVQTMQSNISGLQQNVQAMQDGFARQMDINEQLKKQLDELSSRVETIVVAGPGNGGGDFVRSIQDDPKLAGDFQKVVQGKVIFDNQTGEPQRIFINGAEWEVITGRSSMLVPYGRVTFHTRATNDGGLTQFNLDNWTRQGDLFVLNVPLQHTPTAESVNR